MHRSNHHELRSKPTSGPVSDSMDIDEDGPQLESEDEQVEVDVLPDAGSDSAASEAEADVEEPEEYELEDEDDEIQESRSPSILPAPTPKSPLKIKFKVRGGAVTRGRRTRAAAVQVESEVESEESSEEEMPQNVRLTKRQAALAKARKGVASSDTSGDDEHDPLPNTKKRSSATLDPSELALRKEESARKRRNVSEKKLQNEKAETINRLLKKQSRPRNKRTTALSTPIEVPTPPVPVAPSEHGTEENRIEHEGEKDGEMGGEGDVPPPTMYRWISTTRGLPPSSTDAEKNSPEDPVMRISFSIPASSPLHTISAAPPSPAIEKKAQAPAVCGVAGCGKDRRYRLVGGEWGAGACGMGHLKVLEGR
ncbi:hypothetical protein B0H12DRAFT_1327683 [Mycena haematopus]|nr:hypothetical protein B0H12DRAFT_1327683 [Mycena haematopus]